MVFLSYEPSYLRHLHRDLVHTHVVSEAVGVLVHDASWWKQFPTISASFTSR